MLIVIEMEGDPKIRFSVVDRCRRPCDEWRNCDDSNADVTSRSWVYADSDGDGKEIQKTRY